MRGEVKGEAERIEILDNRFIPRIGLEIHIQITGSTRKAFAPESYKPSSEPNTYISEVSLGYPGSLPHPSYRFIESCILLGIALNCKINNVIVFHRKNYFYPDLPKGYQISQHEFPLATDGLVKLERGKFLVRIKEIHIEEDTGKVIHDIHPVFSLIDYNRAGVPLLELVTEPDISTPQQASSFVRYIRRLVRYLGISDGNMEEGNLRCDTNVSLFDLHYKIQHNKVEIKNLNSLKHIEMALNYEIKRQMEIIRKALPDSNSTTRELSLKPDEFDDIIKGITSTGDGKNTSPVMRETRMFDVKTEKTYPLRTKEYAHDYRYFPEPDIPPIIIHEEVIENIRKKMPELAEEKLQRYLKIGINEKEAEIIIEEIDFAEYFEKVINSSKDVKVASSVMCGCVRAFLNEHNISIKEFPIPPEKIAELVNMIVDGVVARHVATQDIFTEMIKSPESSPYEIARKMGKIISGDEENITGIIDELIKKYPEKVQEYKKGKKGIIGMFMGELNRRMRGKFNPVIASKIITKKLEEA